MEGRWEDMFAWMEGVSSCIRPVLVRDGEDIGLGQGEGIKPGTRVQDLSLIFMQVRALGETGRPGDML